MIWRHDFYTVYLFPKGPKRLGMCLSGYELNKLTRRYGKPTKVTYSYERVQEEFGWAT